MYGNGNTNNMNSNAMSGPTSWHPINPTSSYDWELPHPIRALAFDEEDGVSEEQHESAQDHPTPSIFDFENQFIAPILASWSFSSPQNQEVNANRQRLDSASSTSTVRTVQSQGDHRQRKKQALGDATNTAPVLRISRSRFL